MDLPAVTGARPPAEASRQTAESEPFDLELDDLPARRETGGPAASGLDVDLPAVPSAHTKPAPLELEADLPTAADRFRAGRSGAPGPDLPSLAESRPGLPAPKPRVPAPVPPAGVDDLPSALRPQADLPSPARQVDLPSPSSGIDLPSPAYGVDLPSVSRGADLPAAAGFGELDLPDVGSELPSPAGVLPSLAGSLPAPAAVPPSRASSPAGRLEGDADPFGGTSGDPFGPATVDFGSALDAPETSPASFDPGADPFGVGAPGNDPFGIGAEEGDPFGARSKADPFGRPPSAPPTPFSGSDASASFGEADIEGDASEAVVRKVGGGTEYGEVNLGADEESNAVALDGDVRPFADAADDMEFGELPEEGAPRAEPKGAHRIPSLDSGAGALAEVRARKKRRRLRIAVATAVVLSVAGGALTLVPGVGPFGAHFIEDQIRRGEYERLLSDAVHGSQKLLAEDTYPKAKEALSELDAATGKARRFGPLSAYSAYVGFATILRFGPNPEVHAAAKVRLDELAAGASTEKLDLARATQAAADGQLARARQLLDEVDRHSPKDIAAAITRAEVELRARDRKAALAAWQKAGTLEKSARTAFGLARANLMADDLSGARSLAEETLKRNPNHVGARIMLARIVWETKQDEDAATKWLDEILSKPGTASPEEIVNAQTLLGDVHLGRGRISHAEKAFGEALKINPKASRALSGFGDALFRAGRYSEALARFKAGAQADPDDVQAKVGIAKTSILLERLDEAKAMLEKMRAAHPKDMRVAYWFGRVLESLGERQAAEKAYRDAITAGKDDPDSVQAYVALANLQSQMGQLDAAAQTLEDAQNELAESPAIHKALGKVAMSQGRYADALSEFRKALSLDADDVDATFLVGSALLRLRNFEEALGIFESVAKIDRDYPGLALERGLLFQESGRSEEALKEYEGALAKAPNDPDLMLKVGCGKAAAGNGTEAEELLRKVLAQRPNSAETHHCLGRALMAKNNLSDALNALERAVQLDPNRAEYHLYVGWAANEAGDADKAGAALDKALELDQGLADAYWQRGVLRRRETRPKDAIQDLNKALALRPSRFEAHAALADAYYDLGMEAQALAEWQKAIAAKPDEATWRFRYGKLLNLNLRHAQAAEQLEKAIELAEGSEAKPVWFAEAHRLAALSLGNRREAIVHLQSFLKNSPPGSPFRDEAIEMLRRLGEPWEE